MVNRNRRSDRNPKGSKWTQMDLDLAPKLVIPGSPEESRSKSRRISKKGLDKIVESGNHLGFS